VIGGVSQKVCEQRVVAIKRLVEAIERRRIRIVGEAIASLKKAQLIRARNIGRVVPRCLGAQNQQARVPKPVHE